ncbi:MAG: Ubiquinone biosynthesis O-methyltransferase [Elusimicrobia bacterium]|nr:Ubiquinone biosynthesis O-methyltransferase [Elusimicrobiota bacterium]
MSFSCHHEIPSLVSPKMHVPSQYDIDWHPSTVPVDPGFKGSLKRLKRAMEKNTFLRRTAGCFLNSIFTTVVMNTLEHLVSSPDARVLDVGVRRGDFTNNLRARVVGIDVDFPSLEYIAHHTDIVPFHATAEALPFMAHSFDVVFCTEVIEHVERDDLMVKELARVTAPDGVLLLTTPNGAVVPLVREINHVHLRHYKPAELTTLLSASYEEVNVHSRFIFKWLIEWEASVYQAFTRRPRLWLYALRLILCAVQSFLYYGFEKFLPDRHLGYNLVATARCPKK